MGSIANWKLKAELSSEKRLFCLATPQFPAEWKILCPLGRNDLGFWRLLGSSYWFSTTFEIIISLKFQLHGAHHIVAFSNISTYVIRIIVWFLPYRWERKELTWFKLYKKDLHDPVNHDGVITHLEPDILECEVKWALGSITTNKASGGNGITVELFQILKDDAVKVLHSICQQIWKTQQWPKDWKRSVFIPIPKKDNSKECSNYPTIALISHAS